jgi:hypothetical protein
VRWDVTSGKGVRGTYIPSLRSVLRLCDIVPSLTMTTQKEDFVTLALFLRCLQTGHICLKAPPLSVFTVGLSRIRTID